jgi:UDP-N-acetylglucosamine 2-epimerase (non-hydrolysing)
MIDSLIRFDAEIKASKVLEELSLSSKSYALMTMHRPSNVDNIEGLSILIDMIKNIVSRMKLVFPIHPRTITKLKQFELWSEIENLDGLIMSEALDYFSFQKLILECTCVITDSGGIQEETTFRQIPCLTLRDNTERPSTIELGTNVLVPYKTEELMNQIQLVLNSEFKKGEIPTLWDGNSTDRIVEVIEKILN